MPTIKQSNHGYDCNLVIKTLLLWGFLNKTIIQHLHNVLSQERVETSKSGAGASRFRLFLEIDALLGHRPRSRAMEYGIDSSFLEEQKDGETMFITIYATYNNYKSV